MRLEGLFYGDETMIEVIHCCESALRDIVSAKIVSVVSEGKAAELLRTNHYCCLLICATSNSFDTKINRIECSWVCDSVQVYDVTW